MLGRLGRAAADSVQARFLAADDTELKVRYLTLLSFSPTPRRSRCWRGCTPHPTASGCRRATRRAPRTPCSGSEPGRVSAALLDARDKARARGVYAAPELSRGGYDFLANDSSAVISRTGKWLTEWVKELQPGA